MGGKTYAVRHPRAGAGAALLIVLIGIVPIVPDNHRVHDPTPSDFGLPVHHLSGFHSAHFFLNASALLVVSSLAADWKGVQKAGAAGWINKEEESISACEAGWLNPDFLG